MKFTPDRGELVLLTFSPQAGKEQSGRRPALVLTPKVYNHVTGLMLCCPITNRIRGTENEVPLPKSSGVSGVILANEIRSVDWESRHAELRGKVSPAVLEDVGTVLKTLLSFD